MANEIDEIKNVGKDTPVASDVKDSADSKKSKDKAHTEEHNEQHYRCNRRMSGGWTVHLRYRLAFRIPQQSDTGLTGSRG